GPKSWLSIKRWLGRSDEGVYPRRLRWHRWGLEGAAYGRNLRRALRSMVKTTGLIGRPHLAPPKAFDNKTHGKGATGFSLPRPVAPWSLGDAERQKFSALLKMLRARLT